MIHGKQLNLLNLKCSNLSIVFFAIAGQCLPSCGARRVSRVSQGRFLDREVTDVD